MSESLDDQDSLWGDQITRPTSVCMSYLFWGLHNSQRMGDDLHHSFLQLKNLMVCLCAVGPFTLRIRGVGCAYMKDATVLPDGKFDGGPAAIMSLTTTEKLCDHWNSLRHTDGFPYLLSTFEDLTLWEFLAYSFDPNAASSLSEIHRSLPDGLMCCTVEMFSQVSNLLDRRALRMCRAGRRSAAALRKHRNVKAEKLHSATIQRDVALELWNRARPKSNPLPVSKPDTQLQFI